MALRRTWWLGRRPGLTVMNGVVANIIPEDRRGRRISTHFMERTREPKQTVGGFHWAARQIAEH